MNLSILIPHKSTPKNDQALELNLKMLRENTREQDREVIVVENYGDPYLMWNEYAKHARGRVLAFTSSDMLPAPDWDVFMLKHVHDNAVVTGYLVEPGVIGVAPQNIQVDFGRSPETFRREMFEKACGKYDFPEAVPGRGWYMPVMWTKDFFLNRLGGYHFIKPFPYHNDIHTFEKCEQLGAEFIRTRSFHFHFQALSFTEHDARR